ncbi:YdeI/OmpD-associated family protein [Nocardioides coralli]|uniref:YdeI/OmpD-associated family protein n=1 Tax=Nocardioides coralli TaxID=2872154 RepID=UPI001CA40818|nr:YdeI/OmpD-associated family protein [Nocardioides coralli]QZY29291.1 YdeI/OmpD-associated family protein [Nocardioides coralli]
MIGFDGLVEPLEWGRSTYTVLRVPPELVSAARDRGTRRVAGTIEGGRVNLALTTAPVIDDHFVWFGRTLQRRLGVAVGEPVRAELGPVDPDVVELPDDVASALAEAGCRPAWDDLPAGRRRSLLYRVESAGTERTRRSRIAELVVEVG